MANSLVKERTKLTKSAMQTCRARRHRMTRVDWRHEEARGTPNKYGYWNGYAKCKVCGAYLKLETHPAPNSIDISGAAVALNCRY